MCMAGLPISIARQFCNIHLLACSNKVTAVQMISALVNELLILEKGIIVYDALLKCDILVIAPVICILADNARASEIVNHMGATTTMFCRKCMVSCLLSW